MDTPPTGVTGQYAELERELAQTKQQLALFKAIAGNFPIAGTVWKLENLDDPFSLRLLFATAANTQTVGFDFNADTGKTIREIFPHIAMEHIGPYIAALQSGKTMEIIQNTEKDQRAYEQILSVKLIPLDRQHLLISSENITEKLKFEETREQLRSQEEMIRLQQVALEELSTPLIPLTDDITVMPLVGAVDSQRAQQVIETLLTGVSEHHARIAILDITGVPIVDTQVANALIRAAQAVSLLGARVVLTGIRPEVAQTLVGLGVDLSSITTRNNLQSGIAFANSLR